MQRRTRLYDRRQVPVASLPIYPSHFKQTQSRAATLTNGKRHSCEICDGDNGPVEDSNFEDTTAFNSQELMEAFKRKTQELCEETRKQCGQRLERQEAQHERQVQNLQRQLREVVGNCVSLAEHEQILAMTAKEQQRQLEEARRRHQSDLRELEQRYEQEWQTKVAAVRKQSDRENTVLMQRVEQLELLRNEAAAEAKEHQLSELRWSEKLQEADRMKEAVENRVEDVKKRLEDACRIILALKTRVRHHTRLTRALKLQRDKTIETRDEVMKCKLAQAELKGDMDTRVASLERELDHALRAVAGEKANTSALQSEVAGLREQLQRQQCSAAELTAKAALSTDHRAIERKQFQKEVDALRKALQVERQTVNDATARLEMLQQRATEEQLQYETLAQDLRTRLEVQQTTEASLKQQLLRLKQRVEQFKAVMEKVLTENKRLGEEVSNRDASTEAWAKKLFGRQ